MDAKKLIADRINNYLNVAIGSVMGVFAGSAWSTVRAFLRDPEYYASRGGAWYSGIITSGIVTAVVIAGIGIARKKVNEKFAAAEAAISGNGNAADVKSAVEGGNAAEGANASEAGKSADAKAEGK